MYKWSAYLRQTIVCIYIFYLRFSFYQSKTGEKRFFPKQAGKNILKLMDVFTFYRITINL